MQGAIDEDDFNVRQWRLREGFERKQMAVAATG